MNKLKSYCVIAISVLALSVTGCGQDNAAERNA